MTVKRATMDYKLAKFLVYFKGIFGIIELIIGIGLLIVGPKALNKYMLWLVEFEPFDKPNKVIDITTQFIADHILGSLHTLIALYMIVHGLVFIAVVIALVHKKLWAFPTAGIILSLFIIYQIYRLTLTFSLILLIFTLIDITIIFFLKYEYKRVKLELKIS